MNINTLATNDLAEQKKREALAMSSKWAKTGLLEGLGDRDKGIVATLLENQARQLLKEANETSTQSGAEAWNGVALPLIRRIFGDIASKEFLSVQPMNMPSGLVFWLEYKYATGQPGFTTNSGLNSQNDSVWGVTDATKGTAAGTGGLYGAGRFGYSINDYSSSAFRCNETASAANILVGTGSVDSCNLTSDINFNSDFSASVVTAAQIKKITVPISGSSPNNDITNADLKGARAFTITGTGIAAVYNEFTTVSPTNSTVTFVVSGSITTATDIVLYYHKQPTDITRGDFEENKTQENPLDIPSLDLQYHQDTIVAKTRKLKAQWTPEFAQDINAYQNIDVEAELSSVLGEYVSQEIDLELLDMLIAGAQTTDYWSAQLGYVYNAGSRAFSATAANVAAYNQGTWFQTLGTKIQKMSNEIHSLTLRGGANFLVTSPRVATILESIPGYAADTNGDSMKFAMGVQKIGTINSRFTVYKNPYMRSNVILMGYRGPQWLEQGAVYCPYIPLIMTPTVLDPDNYTPRKAVMTRYAKKLLRPEFYGKIYVKDLDTI